MYRVVAEFDACDLKDSVFDNIGCKWDPISQKFSDGLSGAEAKAKIIAMFEEKKEAPIVTIDFLYISADLQHEPAFVQHVNNELFTPWLKENSVNENGHYTFASTHMQVTCGLCGCLSQQQMANFLIIMRRMSMGLILGGTPNS